MTDLDRLDVPTLRLTGEQIGSISPPPDGDWFVDFDEYEEFVPKRMLDSLVAENKALREVEKAARVLAAYDPKEPTEGHLVAVVGLRAALHHKDGAS